MQVTQSVSSTSLAPVHDATHSPPHSSKPVSHSQPMVELVQTSLVPQESPQAVQLLVVPSGTHELPLRQNPALHVKSQLPLTHAGVPLVGAVVQAVQDAPHALGLVLATHEPPLGQNPALHVKPQLPFAHVVVALATVGQTVPQLPQLLMFVLRFVSQPLVRLASQLQNPAVHWQRLPVPVPMQAEFVGQAGSWVRSHLTVLTCVCAAVQVVAAPAEGSLKTPPMVAARLAPRSLSIFRRGAAPASSLAMLSNFSPSMLTSSPKLPRPERQPQASNDPHTVSLPPCADPSPVGLSYSPLCCGNEYLA
jgi:hypothetical protein